MGNSASARRSARNGARIAPLGRASPAAFPPLVLAATADEAATFPLPPPGWGGHYGDDGRPVAKEGEDVWYLETELVTDGAADAAPGDSVYHKMFLDAMNGGDARFLLLSDLFSMGYRLPEVGRELLREALADEQRRFTRLRSLHTLGVLRVRRVRAPPQQPRPEGKGTGMGEGKGAPVSDEKKKKKNENDRAAEPWDAALIRAAAQSPDPEYRALLASALADPKMTYPRLNHMCLVGGYSTPEVRAAQRALAELMPPGPERDLQISGLAGSGIWPFNAAVLARVQADARAAWQGGGDAFVHSGGGGGGGVVEGKPAAVHDCGGDDGDGVPPLVCLRIWENFWNRECGGGAAVDDQRTDKPLKRV